MKAWRLHEYGQPLDVLQLETVDIPDPENNDPAVIASAAVSVRLELP